MSDYEIGLPYHGLSLNGRLILSNGDNKFFTSPTDGNTFVVRNSSAPGVNRTAEQLVADALAGKEWRDYGLISGSLRQIGGKELGLGSWIYSDPSGASWLIKGTITDNEDDTITIEVTLVSPFGLFKKGDLSIDRVLYSGTHATRDTGFELNNKVTERLGVCPSEDGSGCFFNIYNIWGLIAERFQAHKLGASGDEVFPVLDSVFKLTISGSGSKELGMIGNGISAVLIEDPEELHPNSGWNIETGADFFPFPTDVAIWFVWHDWECLDWSGEDLSCCLHSKHPYSTYGEKAQAYTQDLGNSQKYHFAKIYVGNNEREISYQHDSTWWEDKEVTETGTMTDTLHDYNTCCPCWNDYQDHVYTGSIIGYAAHYTDTTDEAIFKIGDFVETRTRVQSYQLIGNADYNWSTTDRSYTYVPESTDVGSDYIYYWITTNNSGVVFTTDTPEQGKMVGSYNHTMDLTEPMGYTCAYQPIDGEFVYGYDWLEPVGYV